MRKKNICIIYTGGTIGMVPSDKGYVPKPGVFERLLRSINDIHRPEFPLWEFIEFSPLLDSSNIAVRDWNKIAHMIYQRYNEFDGFVVLHGTDTMAYSASALSFMLEHLNKPVVFTGSQIPLCMMRSDGLDNIVNSILVAASGCVHEVCLYFGGRLLRGNRSTKTSADLLEAFDSPNAPHLAETGIEIQYNYDIIRPAGTEALHLQEFMDVPIGVLKVFPGIQFPLFESIMTETLKAIVLEAFGAGNIPSGFDSGLLPLLEKAHQNGTIIVVCSQCQRGSVKLGAYETSAGLTQAEAVSGNDMTIEAAVTKLYYLFSCGYSKDEIRKKMEENLCGELS